MPSSRYHFDPRPYESSLAAIIEDILAQEHLDAKGLQRIVLEHPKDGRGAFSKSEIIGGFRHFARRYGWRGEAAFVDRLKMKPVRTESGVAPVTVLTQPFPCPGRCIFCPSDVRMPKSYLTREPGAQRAARHDFDPYGQTRSRLAALHRNGHRIDKVELIILGGTWSFYPPGYQRWFVKRCFEAMNDPLPAAGAVPAERPAAAAGSPLPFAANRERIVGGEARRSYNRLVKEFLARRRRRSPGAPQAAPETAREEVQEAAIDGSEDATWSELAEVQRRNEESARRCVGLSVETRPDHLSPEEARRIRRLGATKVQIGVQSLSDEVLAKNRRGHDVAATRRAFALLRQCGFKLQAHWMPNLHGSDPRRDVEDFERLFADPDFRPDELKIYPCSLIESAELMDYYRRRK